MTNQLRQLQKDVAKSDMNFWQKLSDVQSEIVYVCFLQGRGIKRQYKKMMWNEERISQIEL